MNIRFWFWWNDSPVKITLKPNHVYRFGTWKNSDEGWDSKDEYLCYDGKKVGRESVTDGADCDGRLSTSATFICSVLALSSFHPDLKEAKGLGFPSWERRSASQRDYSAEAAGY